MYAKGSRVGWSSVAALIAVIFLSGPLSQKSVAADDDIGGVVRAEVGGEAGVWVIAETDDLETSFKKIVVTDEQGRFLIPDLPRATYQVWVRGYGLVDSKKQPARPGDTLTVVVQEAATPQDAAQIYPANYWYSLIEVPPPTAFPGTGRGGNGIEPEMKTQAHWVSRLKDGCQLCHQMGNKATREFPMLDLNKFDSSLLAWDHRVRLGRHGPFMSNAATRVGRRRLLETYADWSDHIAAGEVPPQPPRPQGVERNLVLTMWGWGGTMGSIHDNIVTDKRNPKLYPNGLLYGIGEGGLYILDPVAHREVQLRSPRRPERLERLGRRANLESGGVEGADRLLPSPYFGEDFWNDLQNEQGGHNPMLDAKGRLWITAGVRSSSDNPAWCKEGSEHPSAKYFPLDIGLSQVVYYDTEANRFEAIETCYSTHHLQFSEDANDTLWFSGPGGVVGWLNTKLYDETGDEQRSQGWCPTVLDTNGDGKITRPWNRERGRLDPARDTLVDGFHYGVIPNPVDGSIWSVQWHGIPPDDPLRPSSVELPGRLVRLELGNNPPETCKAEAYEPPFENPKVDPSQWGYTPRGIDVDRHGVIWTALSGSGHLASFDRRKCAVVNGSQATGQHCAEGWTLYQTPGPRMKGVTGSANADFHYYNWVDQFDTLGLGPNVPIAAGTGSDSLLALLPETGEWVVMRMPYPLGMYTRGLNGRIDDPDAGWKGRGVWASYDSMSNWHAEGGKGGGIVKFQIRPHPLAE